MFATNVLNRENQFAASRVSSPSPSPSPSCNSTIPGCCDASNNPIEPIGCCTEYTGGIISLCLACGVGMVPNCCIPYSAIACPSVLPSPTPTPSPSPTPIPAVAMSLNDLSSDSGITMGLSTSRQASSRSSNGTELGYAVAKGDVNGDGRQDDIVAANTGEIFVLYGSDSPASYTDLRSGADVVITGIMGDTANTIAVGDFNGDKIDDIAVGVPHFPVLTATPGRVLVFFGSKSLAKSIDATNANVTLQPVRPNDQIGSSVQVVDVTGDEISDLLTCSMNANKGAGQCYVMSGSNKLSSSLKAKNALVTFNGSRKDDGLSTIVAGDMDGDNITDVLLGASNANSGTGAAYLFSGSGGFSGVVSVDKAKIIFNGKNIGDKVGSTLALGDVTNDNYDDVFIAAPGANAARGIVYVFIGQKAMSSRLNSNMANIQYYGINPNDGLGSAIVITNLNGNRFNDVLMGAANANGGNGQIYGFLGGYGPLQSGFPQSFVNASTAQLIIDGNGRAGFALAARDTNQNQGVVIGAPWTADGGGLAYEIFLPIPDLFYAPPSPTPTPAPKKVQDYGEGEGEGEGESRSVRQFSARSTVKKYRSLSQPEYLRSKAQQQLTPVLEHPVEVGPLEEGQTEASGMQSITQGMQTVVDYMAGWFNLRWLGFPAVAAEPTLTVGNLERILEEPDLSAVDPVVQRRLSNTPIPTPLGYSSGAEAICRTIDENKGCCTPVEMKRTNAKGASVKCNTPVPTPSPVPTFLGHSSSVVCHTIDENKGYCTPVKGSLANVARKMPGNMEDPLKFSAVGVSDIVTPVSLTTNRDAGLLSYGWKTLSSFWQSSDKPTVSDPGLEVRMRDLQAEINSGLLEEGSSKELLINCQQQLNVLRENPGAIQPKDLTNLQSNINAADSKVRGLDEFVTPREISALRSVGLFAETSTARVSALPQLAAPTNFTLSKLG